MNDQEQAELLHPLVQAVQAPPTAAELSGRAEALAAFRASRRWRQAGRGGLRLLSGTGMVVAASSLAVSLTGVTAAAYTAALPREVQGAAHRLFHRIGVPPPSHRSPWASGARPDGAATAEGELPVVVLHSAVVPWASPVTVQLHLHDARAAGELATLLERAPGAREWSPVGRDRVTTDGVAQVVIAHVEHALQLRWSLTSVTTRYGPISMLRVRPPLSAMLDTRSADVGSMVLLVVTTDRAQWGRQVRIQRLARSGWVDVGEVTVGQDGRGSLRLDTAQAGTTQYRCLLPGNDWFGPAASTPVTLVVR